MTTPTTADSTLDVGVYVARRDVEDLRRMLPDLDIRVGATRDIVEPSRPRTVAEVAAGVSVPTITTTVPDEYVRLTDLHDWRSAIIDGHGHRRGTPAWWSAFVTEFYPLLTPDTPVTLYRGLTKETGPTIFDVPDGGLRDIGCYWTLNPLVAQGFAVTASGRGDGVGLVASIDMTLGEAVAAAGNGNGMVVHNNLAFASGVDRAYPTEMAIVLDYRILPEHVKATARTVHADAIGPTGLGIGETPGMREHIARRGSWPRMLLRARGMTASERAVDDARIALGSALAREHQVHGAHPDVQADARAAVDDATITLAALLTDTAAGISVHDHAQAVTVPISAVHAHNHVLHDALEASGHDMDDVRRILVKSADGSVARVDLTAYSASPASLRGVITALEEALQTPLVVDTLGQATRPSVTTTHADIAAVYRAASRDGQDAFRRAIGTHTATGIPVDVTALAGTHLQARVHLRAPRSPVLTPGTTARILA